MDLYVRDHNGNTLSTEELADLDSLRVAKVEAHVTDAGNLMVTVDLWSELFMDDPARAGELDAAGYPHA